MKAKQLQVINVKNCSACPALHQNSEYPESICRINGESWDMGYYRYGDPAPDWCPLRPCSGVKLKLVE